MKTIKIKHVNGPDIAIITLWHRFTTKQGDIIDVNEIELETLLTKEFDDKPIFELVKQDKKQSEQLQDKNESVEV